MRLLIIALFLFLPLTTQAISLPEVDEDVRLQLEQLPIEQQMCLERTPWDYRIIRPTTINLDSELIRFRMNIYLDLDDKIVETRCH